MVKSKFQISVSTVQVATVGKTCRKGGGREWRGRRGGAVGRRPAGTARPVVARMSAVTAAEAAVADGDKVTVATDRGSVTVPVEVVPMADHVVWLPAAGLSQGSRAGTAPAGAPYPGGQEPAAVQGGTTIRAEL